MSRKRGNKKKDTNVVQNTALGTIMNASMIIFSFTCIFPLVWMVYSSFKSSKAFNKDIVALPKSLNFENYQVIFKDSNVITAMGNSLRVTAFSVALIVIFGFVTGYILSRFHFKGSRGLYYLFLIGLLIPIHSLMVPIYVVFNKFGLTDQWFTLIIPYLAFGLPIAIFLVEGFVKGIPNALEEAAAIDGSSFTKTMFNIMLPVCKPILMTIAILQTFACWNEFSFALVLLNSPKIRTVPLELTQFSGQFTSNYPKMLTGMLITMLPIVIFYFVFSKEIIKGMVTGAVKG